MATYRIFGTLFTLESDDSDLFDGGPTSANLSILEIVAPEGSAFSYQTGTTVLDIGTTALLDTSSITSAQVDGLQILSEDSMVLTQRWNDGNIARETTVLFVLVGDFSTSTPNKAFLFELGGNPLPRLENLEDWNAFITAAVETSVPTLGAFAPDTEIPFDILSSLVGPIKNHSINGISIAGDADNKATSVEASELTFTAPEGSSFS